MHPSCGLGESTCSPEESCTHDHISNKLEHARDNVHSRRRSAMDRVRIQAMPEAHMSDVMYIKFGGPCKKMRATDCIVQGLQLGGTSDHEFGLKHCPS